MSEDAEAIGTPAQYKAMAHPLRQRLLTAVDEEEATISQLASALGTLKGNIAHHIKILERAGLVTVVRTRKVRGGTERYYGRSNRYLSIRRENADSSGAARLMSAVADEMADASQPPVFLAIRHARLTAEQIDRLRDLLVSAANPDELPDAGPDEPRYGVAISIYPMD